jgi:hypothetical protein
MNERTNEDRLVAEFEAFVARAQLPVPPDRRDALYAAFREMRDMLDLLRQDLPPGAEPAGAFDVTRVTRSL